MNMLWTTRRMALSKTAAVFVLLLTFTLTSEPAKTQDKPATATQISSLPADLPISPIEQAEKVGTAYHISLKDLTKLALQNNLDIAIQDTNEELYQKRVLQAYGPYDPAISATLGVRSNLSPNTNQVNMSTQGPANSLTTDTWNVSISQNIPTGGGISASFNTNRQNTNQLFALFNPQYNSSVSLNFLQPLLRNRQIDQNRGTIKLYNLDVKLSDSQFKQTVVNTIATMQSSYWNLVYAVRYYDIVKALAKLNQITVNNNREKVRIGVLAPIEITVAQSTLATTMVSLITARMNIMVAENNLLSMISSDHNAEIWHKVIVPTETPDFVEYKMGLDEAIDAALAKRPELEQLDIQLQENGVNFHVTTNQKKWQFDFQGSFGTVGVAGPQNIMSGQPVIPSELVGGIGTTYSSLFTQGFRNWYAGVQVGIPLRNRSLDSQIGQLEIQKKSLLLNRKSTELKIVVAIRNAFDTLDTNRQNIETTRIARELAQAQLDGEEKRFQAGMSENFLVLQRQTDLATAEGAELQALVSYKQSIIAVQQAMYTLLDSSDFEIVGSGPKVK